MSASQAEHPTTNVQRRTFKLRPTARGLALGVERSMLNIEYFDSSSPHSSITPSLPAGSAAARLRQVANLSYPGEGA
jgi:hypothetical protein